MRGAIRIDLGQQLVFARIVGE